MHDRDWIAKDPAAERWLRFKADGTKRQYLIVLDQFLNFTAPEMGLKDASSLISWAKPRDNLEVQDLIEKWGEHQPQRSQRMSIVGSLFKRNGVSLPSMPRQRDQAKQYHRGYSREEIQTLLSYLDHPMQKLYVLFAKDSGLRAQDLLALKYRHVHRGLKPMKTGKEFVHLALEPAFYDRRKASGITFIGPNAVELLRELIEQKLVKTDVEAPIFPFAYPTIKESLKIAKKKAGLDPIIQPSHGFRKFFEGCLDRANLDLDKKRQLEGHSLGVRWAYTDQSVDQLRNLYAQAYKFLDLSEQGAIDQTVGNLSQQVADLRDENKQLKDELSKQKGIETLVREYLP